MFAFDRSKVKAVAIVMAGIATIQMWPTAYAEHQSKATLAERAEIKAPKKSKKKKAGHFETARSLTLSRTSPWRMSRAVSLPVPVGPQTEQDEKADRVEVVLASARKQLGKPYRWAAVGPNSFDCSGFTMYVWQKAGVTLPHNSGAQRAATRHVALEDMKPGDLIFATGHVGLYIGKGKMIHAPRSGRHVEIAPIHSRAYGAGRPTA